MGQGLDVEAASRDFGGHEQEDPTGLEVRERTNALGLRLVAVDRRGGDAIVGELLGEPVRPVLGAGEDECLVDLTGTNEVREQLPLPLAVDRMDDLLDEVDGGVLGRDLHRCGSVEKPFGQGADLAGEGGAEQQVLTSIRQQREDLPDVADEAHVEHAIRLVQDEDLHRAQVDGALARMVEQAPGVATTISAPRRSAPTWPPKPTPP